MHLLYNKTWEINIFQFQSQKQPLLICCSFTKPTNDSFLPSNSLLLALGGDSWPSLFYSINHDFIVLYTKGIQKNLGDQFEFA